MGTDRTNERDAVIAAGSIPVSVDSVATDGRGRKVRTFTVGRAVVTHDGRGGKACWRVMLDGRNIGTDYRGNAIMLALAALHAVGSPANGAQNPTTLPDVTGAG